jgi:hypothetical protein
MSTTKKQLKKGDKVRWRLVNRMGHKRELRGVGVITKVFPPFGNVPWTCEVSTYKDGVLFADEVSRA